jgi:hypothetical protein
MRRSVAPVVKCNLDSSQEVTMKKMLPALAALAFLLFPLGAFAAGGDCDGEDVVDTLICPGTMTNAPGGGCVFSG